MPCLSPFYTYITCWTRTEGRGGNPEAHLLYLKRIFSLLHLLQVKTHHVSQPYQPAGDMRKIRAVTYRVKKV